MSRTLSPRHIRRRKVVYVAIIVAAVAVAAISGGLFGVTVLGAGFAFLVLVFDAGMAVGDQISRRRPPQP